MNGLSRQVKENICLDLLSPNLNAPLSNTERFVSCLSGFRNLQCNNPMAGPLPIVVALALALVCAQGKLSFQIQLKQLTRAPKLSPPI